MNKIKCSICPGKDAVNESVNNPGIFYCSSCVNYICREYGTHHLKKLPSDSDDFWQFMKKTLQGDVVDNKFLKANMTNTDLTPKQQYTLETGKPAEITIKYDSPEFLHWYIEKRINEIIKKEE